MNPRRNCPELESILPVLPKSNPELRFRPINRTLLQYEEPVNSRLVLPRLRHRLVQYHPRPPAIIYWVLPDKEPRLTFKDVRLVLILLHYGPRLHPIRKKQLARHCQLGRQIILVSKFLRLISCHPNFYPNPYIEKLLILINEISVTSLQVELMNFLVRRLKGSMVHNQLSVGSLNKMWMKQLVFFSIYLKDYVRGFTPQYSL